MGRGRTTRTLKHLAVFAVSLLIPVLAYEIFRLAYFGDPLPNTFYAKGGPTIRTATALLLLHPDAMLKLHGLAAALFGGPLATWSVIGAAAASVAAFARRTVTWVLLPTGLAALLAAVSYTLLPYDWMPEFRFATAFFPCAYLFLAVALLNLPGRFGRQLRTPRLGVPVCLVISAYTLGVCSIRTWRFIDAKPIPVSEVLDTNDRFVGYARQLGVGSPSILIADVGGLLYRNELEVQDLGMLCNATIAKTLGEGVPQMDFARFHDYVFAQRPTFVATRAYHSWLARLDTDPRFRELYTPIFEYTDQWVIERYRETIRSGDFVLKDAVGGREDVLREIRESARDVPYAGLIRRRPPE
jgi:hypothetical protein